MNNPFAFLMSGFRQGAARDGARVTSRYGMVIALAVCGVMGLVVNGVLTAALAMRDFNQPAGFVLNLVRVNDDSYWIVIDEQRSWGCLSRQVSLVLRRFNNGDQMDEIAAEFNAIGSETPRWSRIGSLVTDGARSAAIDSEKGVGWPMIAAWYNTDTYALSIINVSPSRGSILGYIGIIPDEIVWTGAIVNTLVYWFFLFAATQVGFVILRRLRQCKDLCPKCRYDLRAAPSGGCPECGWNRPAGEGESSATAC